VWFCVDTKNCHHNRLGICQLNILHHSGKGRLRGKGDHVPTGTRRFREPYISIVVKHNKMNDDFGFLRQNAVSRQYSGHNSKCYICRLPPQLSPIGLTAYVWLGLHVDTVRLMRSGNIQYCMQRWKMSCFTKKLTDKGDDSITRIIHSLAKTISNMPYRFCSDRLYRS
jgi:hypothetical protein